MAQKTISVLCIWNANHKLFLTTIFAAVETLRGTANGVFGNLLIADFGMKIVKG